MSQNLALESREDPARIERTIAKALAHIKRRRPFTIDPWSQVGSTLTHEATILLIRSKRRPKEDP